MLNHVDKRDPDLLYIFPEAIAEIPFEVFRAFKRGGISLLDSEEEKATCPEAH
jgi:hypothetical protein